MNPLKDRIKFFLVNFAHNRDLDRERPRINGNPSGTVDDMLQYSIRLWGRPDSGVTEQEIRDMCDYLLKTDQVRVHADGNVTVGKVLFENAVPVTEAANNAAKEIMAGLDDRRGSPTGTWADDVRDEAVNSWAALIDKHMGTQP